MTDHGLMEETSPLKTGPFSHRSECGALFEGEHPRRRVARASGGSTQHSSREAASRSISALT